MRQIKRVSEKERHAWNEGMQTFENDQWHTSKDEPPWHIPEKFVPLSDPDEINAFLCCPSAVTQIESVEKADHALRLRMILIAVDPNTPDLAKRLGIEAEKIRTAHPLPIKKPRGRSSKSGNVSGIGLDTLGAWRTHRIIELHELRLREFDPRKQRKQVAAWLFPEHQNQRARGKMLDRSVELLDEALAAARVIDAQTR
jgi:hypothetical protein